MLKDTEEHLAETIRLGPGYYRIRERYDYAVESDERYIEKLKKQIAEFDQDKLNKNQQIVLEWLKDDYKEYGDPIVAIGDLGDEILPSRWKTCLQATYEKLDTQQKWEVLAAFAEWGKEEVAK
ncbi:hypothetical protein [Enterococcus gilvus]|uniref:hypothetical protein n=1 Tax=Enterococcus gilvus TaxID=160453 RepID=UPI00345E67C4